MRKKEGIIKRILIVDNDRIIRQFLSEELSEEGYDVFECGDISLLNDNIDQYSPHIIVMDYRSDLQNGSGLLKDIRQRYGDLPVVLCTTYAVSNFNTPPTTGNYFVSKSSDLRELKSAIKRALYMGSDFEMNSQPGTVDFHEGSSSIGSVVGENISFLKKL